MTNNIQLPVDSSKIIKELTAGSKLYGLHTLESDTDRYILYVDHESRLFPDSKLNFKVQSDDLTVEADVVELGEFIKACLRENPPLKDLEVLASLYTRNSGNEPWVFDMVNLLFGNPDIVKLGYYREIQRRYNKLFTRVHNKTGKNFNSEQGYDTKFAAHLYRVLKSLAVWVNHEYDVLPTLNFVNIRPKYFDIKSGKIEEEEFKKIIDELIFVYAPDYTEALKEGAGKYDFKPQIKEIYWNAVRYYAKNGPE